MTGDANRIFHTQSEVAIRTMPREIMAGRDADKPVPDIGAHLGKPRAAGIEAVAVIAGSQLLSAWAQCGHPNIWYMDFSVSRLRSAKSTGLSGDAGRTGGDHACA